MLPDLPVIRVEPVGGAEPSGRRFLEVRRRVHRVHYADGTVSEAFTYDEVVRAALDAVVIVAHWTVDGERWVHLRSAVRPPVVGREERSPAERAARHGGLWELPAGLVEPAERGAAGAAAAARRELAEELGYDVPADALTPLGPSTFPTAAVIAERHYFFEVEVEPSRRGEPTLDGSPLERGGVVVALPLADALEGCRTGWIEDAKTELGLRRLAELRR